MIIFLKNTENHFFAVEIKANPSPFTLEKLRWLFGNGTLIEAQSLEGYFVGPRREMITPWSTNAVEITQNMAIEGITRIEQYQRVDGSSAKHDPMLQELYNGMGQDIFTIHRDPDPIRFITDIAAYSRQEGLALSDDEVAYLNGVSSSIGRQLTDSEVFGFSQVNSEHCRHKIFNGTFVIDSKTKEKSLFQLIKDTTEANPNGVVSAYKDNVAFVAGPKAQIFAPRTQDKADFFELNEADTILSLKAETHNFPTTVEPFNGAATGSGGEIRDRMAGGLGSFPLAGTAVYMTSYPRTEPNRPWEESNAPREWLYQTPEEILIKASNGASDFGNKFGQPLICGSLLTFENVTRQQKFGYDKVIMLAGGVGYARRRDAQKGTPVKGNRIVVMGGDNYRIGMGGGAVSSVATGEYNTSLELNAVQRANPEMQKRVYNAIRALAEGANNPVISIHDHGAGGHLNCLSELVDQAGGTIHLEKLPVGDPTLSDKEIIGNESQERMGLVIDAKDMPLLERIAARERAPMYDVGQITGDKHFRFQAADGRKPMDFRLEHMFGKPPKTVMVDTTQQQDLPNLAYRAELVEDYINWVLGLEAVACKDWLTNKVDRSVTGRVARQQTVGRVQLPLADVAVMALDYQGNRGVATSIGHAPVAALSDAARGSILSVAEALTNLVWAQLANGLKGVSLSANWMWPCRNPGEDARLYQAVEAVSVFCQRLGINIPTGKDSLSMTQKYPDGQQVLSPGTVIISSIAEVLDIRKTVTPNLKLQQGTELLYIDLSFESLKLGGSSFAQVLNAVGSGVPSVNDPESFVAAFSAIQDLIARGLVLAGHDVSSGGLITCLLEMAFPNPSGGLNISADAFGEDDLVKILFSENPSVVIQVAGDGAARALLAERGVRVSVIGVPTDNRNLSIKHKGSILNLEIDNLRDRWYRSSWLLDRKQSGEGLAKQRFEGYKHQPLEYKFPETFTGTFKQYGINPNRLEATGTRAAIIREKGVNGDREMAYMLYLAGFDVKDVHMTDLISGQETLDDINLVVYVGGFSNSDVLGSAKGWAGAFLYNPKAKETLDRFYARPDTLSLGVCNGCQLMVELGLLHPNHASKPKMLHNQSGKFESHFLTITIGENKSVMLSSLSGSRLGIWVAHGEGKFSLKGSEGSYSIVAKYSYGQYPANPNGSDYDAAAIASSDGRHLAIMPHLERAFYPWQCAHYPEDRTNDQVTPWIEAFVNAREWIKRMK